MRALALALLLAASVSEACARDRHSYRFYRDFYEEHHQTKRRARLPSWGESAPVPYWDCDAVTINLFGGQRRTIKWICINAKER
jgi:hypothetical protein